MSAADRHQQTPTPVRLPDELKAALKAEASANDRSLNGEVIARLRDSFHPDGMTLRDHFAGLAMQALIAEPQWKGEGEARYFKVAPEPGEAIDQIALAAYRIADAMLKARTAS